MIHTNRLIPNRKSAEQDLGIWYQCNQGHFTQCKTPKMRDYYCTDCKKIVDKKKSKKYSDTAKRFKTYKRITVPITQSDGQILLLKLYTQSSRRNYRFFRRFEL